MGLRSRKRRFAGITHDDAFDVETSSYTSTSPLSDHLRQSQDNVDAFNQFWKQMIAALAYMLAVYELYVLLTTVASNTAETAGVLAVLVLMKLVSCAAIYSVKELVLATGTGHSLCFSLCVVHTGMWLLLRVYGVASTFIRNSIPLCAVYYVCAAMTVWFIGNNVKSELARAEQLQQLVAKFATE
ncbi:hypothetical protein H310_07004 [Aphanomyces invadans]|uniref:Uncharacterized protein n=1 Tax=Aphanomyces invadans TaxID=157072 RepID=A0A024U290_9STRA|nr:hypothetical protein H310_07004 [Aphanomyces invadans]ETW00359.1 hypothetical protein H310_07004 [Aphanomyces invadans]|eukprot:XP_008870494.1 hypothetical protein H310_07004 [Aphanomyces invadans]